MHEVLQILARTLQVSTLAVALATLVGLPLGLCLGRSHFRPAYGAWTLTYTAMALPPVAVGLALYLLLSRTGPLGAWGWLYTPQAMILAQFVLTLPFIVGITANSVAAVPEELYFQLRTLGASDRQARWAMLREARPGLALAIATALGRSLSEVGAVWIVGGNIEQHTRVLTTAVVLETNRGRFGVALALAGVLMTLALATNVVMLALRPRSGP